MPSNQRLASRWWKWTSNARASHKLMSGRNIVLFQELRDALGGQSQTAGVLGPNERELDPLLPDRLCLGRSPGGDDHFRCSPATGHYRSRYSPRPHDIDVRWKPLSDQPTGWNPDLSEGVRMNIRPFVEASILRKNANIKWTEDRGNEPPATQGGVSLVLGRRYLQGRSGERPALTNAEKQAARERLKHKASTRR